MKTIKIDDNCYYAEISNKQFKKILYMFNQIQNRYKIESIIINKNGD